MIKSAIRVRENVLRLVRDIRYEQEKERNRAEIAETRAVELEEQLREVQEETKRLRAEKEGLARSLDVAWTEREADRRLLERCREALAAESEWSTRVRATLSGTGLLRDLDARLGGGS